MISRLRGHQSGQSTQFQDSTLFQNATRQLRLWTLVILCGVALLRASCSSCPACRREVPHSEVPATVPTKAEASTVQVANSTVCQMRTSAPITSRAKASMTSVGIQGAPGRAVMSDGLMSFVERFDAVLTSTFHLKSFPFDAQKLEIIIHPFTVQQPFVTFVPSQLPVWTAAEFNTYSSLESWQFKSITFGIRSAASQFGKNTMAEARFQIAVVRRYGFYLWKVFLPLLLMVIMSWSVFWFDPPEVSSQVTIAVTTILTIIAFALAISLTLPRIPYLTFADAFFLTCYVFAFITMVELTAVHIAYRNERRKVAAMIRRIARWLVPSTFVAINLILIAHFLG